MRHPLLFLVLLTASPGCGSQEAMCDDGLAPSVIGTVVDESGADLPSTLITYTIDGGEPQECTFTEGAAFECGSEELGVFVLSATLWGYYDLTSQLTVYDGACHVNSAEVEIVMVARDCTVQPLPSVAVTLTSLSDALLENPVVSWQAAGSEEREDCSGSGADWVCGSDDAGEFTVYASADGLTEQSQSVVVEWAEDQCHVATVPVLFEFPAAE